MCGSVLCVVRLNTHQPPQPQPPPPQQQQQKDRRDPAAIFLLSLSLPALLCQE